MTEQSDNGSEGTQEAPRAGLLGRLQGVRRRLGTLRGQLIIPYVLLTLVTAMVGTYIVTRLVTSSVRERFVNQMYEASRVVADGVVRRERSQLRALRLVTFTSGMPEALLLGDASPVVALIQPIAVNQGAEAVIAVDRQGREIAGLTLPPGEQAYRRTTGSDFSTEPTVMQVLTGTADARGDKYIGLITTLYGPYLFTAAPVYNAFGDLTGAVLVGSHLDQMVQDLKSESLADILLQATDGTLLTTTIAEPEEGFGAVLLDPGQTATLSTTILTEFGMSGRDYQAAYSPWTVRDQVLGTVAVVLPSNFLVTTEFDQPHGLQRDLRAGDGGDHAARVLAGAEHRPTDPSPAHHGAGCGFRRPRPGERAGTPGRDRRPGAGVRYDDRTAASAHGRSRAPVRRGDRTQPPALGDV